MLMFFLSCFFFFHGPIESEYFFNRSISPIDGTLPGTLTPGRSEPGSNDNEGIFQTPQSYLSGGSSPDAVLCHTQGTFFGVSYPIAGNIVVYSKMQLCVIPRAPI